MLFCAASRLQRSEASAPCCCSRATRHVYEIRSVLLAALPSLGSVAREVIATLADCHGEIGCAELFAQRVGLYNRHRLSRLLAREGLPQIEELSAWFKTLTSVARWEETRLSLCRQALQAQKEPGTYYRTVQRATGMRWRDVCALGIDYVILRFVERCSPHRAGNPNAGAQVTA